jgi:pimeloyl-ACP methyl ester carboxylesterase
VTEGRARDWLERGGFFEWTPPESGERRGALKVFHVEFGDPEAPALLLVHGFPTSSIDWFDVVEELSRERRVCLLDFPGFGFSEKPQGERYTLDRDLELLEYYVSEVLGVNTVAVVGHDRGDSVALALAARCAAGTAPVHLDRLVLSNGNMFLPLSNLTTFQRLVLDPASAPAVLSALTPEMLAAGMGETTFTPPRSPQDPTIAALADTFAFNDGVAVLHDTIQYLVERSKSEQGWLDELARSDVATTLVWGLYDTVSPLRVATYIWNTHLAIKPGQNEFWLLPRANHYLQHDQPREFVEVVTRSLDGRSPDAPGPLSGEASAPILVDRSRPKLPSASEVLAQGASLEELQSSAPGSG